MNPLEVFMPLYNNIATYSLSGSDLEMDHMTYESGIQKLSKQLLFLGKKKANGIQKDMSQGRGRKCCQQSLQDVRFESDPRATNSVLRWKGPQTRKVKWLAKDLTDN